MAVKAKTSYQDLSRVVPVRRSVLLTEEVQSLHALTEM
jgi:hypothetical protein